MTTQRPVVARAFTTGEIVETVVESVWLGERIRVTAIPVLFRGTVVAVMARESALSMTRQRGVMEQVYQSVFDRLATMVARSQFPWDEEEVLATGGPRVGDGVLVLDDQGKVTFASPNSVSALRRLGVHGRLEGQSLTEMGAESAATYRAYFAAHPVVEEVERDEACIILRCIPLLDERRVDGAVVLLRDISELRSRDRLLVSKDATIKEIHHRVKNNLQTISSLLRLQGRRLTEPSAKAAIDESVRRIRSIALVHETLSREDGDEVDFGEIVGPLVRMVEDGADLARATDALRDHRFGRQAPLAGRLVAGRGVDRAAPERRRPRISDWFAGSRRRPPRWAWCWPSVQGCSRSRWWTDGVGIDRRLRPRVDLQPRPGDRAGAHR